MAMGFFMDVLEVETVYDRKDQKTGVVTTYASLRLSGGTIAVPVRDGVKILAGWSGKVSGPVRISLLKSEYKGQLSNRMALLPVQIDTWSPVAELPKSNQSALDQFFGKK